MGIFDWFKGSRRKKVGKPPTARKERTVAEVPKEVPVPARPPAREPPRPPTPYDPIKLLKEELDKERRKSEEQERRLKEMEARFNDVQGRFVELMEKQTKTIELMLIKNTNGQNRASKTTVESPGIEDEGEQVPDLAEPEEDVREDEVPDEETVVREVLRDKVFSNFVVDESNRFAYLATEAVATGIGRKYNPLFIYGPPGVGKTHLLHALANKMIDSDPRTRILYSSTVLFTDELIDALERDDLQGFRKRYHEIDVLLIDDIQTLSGKETTQMEFFHLFNHLYNSQKQIVISSDRPPLEIKELESRLRSRFEGGLIIDINLPTFEGRRQIMYNLSNRSGISLSNEVLDYMAYYLDSNIRELEGGFNRVTAYATLMKEPITITLVRKVLEGVLLKKENDTRYQEGNLPADLRKAIPGKDGSRSGENELEEETEQLEKDLLSELSKELHPRNR